MEQIPDAPWIREAEQLGMPPYGDDPECPVCGASCQTVYEDQSGSICGCDRCMRTMDAWEWMEQEIENNRPD